MDHKTRAGVVAVRTRGSKSMTESMEAVVAIVQQDSGFIVPVCCATIWDNYKEELGRIMHHDIEQAIDIIQRARN